MGRKPKDITGKKFGLLTAERMSDRRTSKGGMFWHCKCECGGTHEVALSNLSCGAVASCGCLPKGWLSEKSKDKIKHDATCVIEGCKNTAKEYGRTLCRRHAQRKRRYNDPYYITPEEIRRKHSRDAMLKLHPVVKPTTYRKLFGRHEHRRIGDR